VRVAVCKGRLFSHLQKFGSLLGCALGSQSLVDDCIGSHSGVGERVGVVCAGFRECSLFGGLLLDFQRMGAGRQGVLLEVDHAGRSTWSVVLLIVDCKGSPFGVDGSVVAAEFGVRGCSLHSAGYPCMFGGQSRSLLGEHVYSYSLSTAKAVASE
jgi:hypothetical protein